MHHPKLFIILIGGILLGIFSSVVQGVLIAPDDHSRRTGSTSWQIDGGDQFTVSSVHEFESIQGANDCDRLVLTVTVGAKFWDLSVSNRYSCHCTPSYVCETPNAAQWSQRYLSPFALSYTDVSTSLHKKILTNVNSPQPNGHHPLTYNIPRALATTSNSIPSAIKVELTFQVELFSDFSIAYQWREEQGYDCRTELEHCVFAAEYVAPKHQPMKVVGQPRLGTRLSRTSQMVAFQQHEQIWTVDRKRPFPSFELTVESECCGTVEPCPSTKMFSQEKDGVFRSPATLPAIAAPCCLQRDALFCRCFNYSASVRFFEPKRLYSNTYTFQQPTTSTYNLSDPSSALPLTPDQVSAAISTEGDQVMVSPAGDHDLQLRMTNYDLTRDHTELYYGNASNLGPSLIRPSSPVLSVPGHQSLGITLLQPFPIKDLWIKVSDNAGNIIFEEQESHVPFVEKKDTCNQVQWMQAIDHNVFADPQGEWDPVDYSPPLRSFGLKVEVRYNRRHSIGRNEKIQKANLLVQWLNDQGSNWNSMSSPIPATLAPEAEEKTYGVTCKQRINNWNTWATISGNTVLTSEHAIRWYEESLIQKLDYNGSQFSDLVNNISSSSEPHGVERLLLSLFAVMRGTSPFDRTSTWFVYFDSFFPREPKHLPWFWTEDTLRQLLGFSEIPRMVDERLSSWKDEYDILSSILPWWSRDVTLSQWKNTRAYIMSVAHDNGTHYRLVPGLNLFHHTGETPNVEIKMDSSGNIQLRNIKGSNIEVDEEIFPDFSASSFTKYDYLLTFGQVPDAAIDVATLPGTNMLLTSDAASRTAIVNEMVLNNPSLTTYKDGLGQFLSVVGAKLGTLPLNVDGFAVTPYQYTKADKILTAERTILTQQFADGTDEYETLV